MIYESWVIFKQIHKPIYLVEIAITEVAAAVPDYRKLNKILKAVWLLIFIIFTYFWSQDIHHSMKGYIFLGEGLYFKLAYHLLNFDLIF